MDYGKEKFRDPCTEEEVEDVKTVLLLLPLVICLCLSRGGLSVTSMLISTANRHTDALLSCGFRN